MESFLRGASPGGTGVIGRVLGLLLQECWVVLEDVAAAVVVIVVVAVVVALLELLLLVTLTPIMWHKTCTATSSVAIRTLLSVTTNQ